MHQIQTPIPSEVLNSTVVQERAFTILIAALAQKSNAAITGMGCEQSA